GVALTAAVLVLDADTGKEVTAPFTVTPGPQRRTDYIVPNIDASRFLVKDVTGQLLRGDGTPLADQADAGAGPGVGFSPDGGFFVTVGIDNMARVWDAWTGKPVTPKLPHDAPVRIIDFTPDGSHVRTISGSVVRLWPLARADQGRGLPLANSSMQRILSEDGNRILEYPGSRGFGGGNEVRVIDSATGQTIAGPIRLWADDEQAAQMPTAQFRPDGRSALFLIRELYTGEDGEQLVRARGLLWDCDSGKTKELWGFDSTQNGTAEFSPDGRFVRTTLSGDTSRMQLRDAVSGEPVGNGVVVPAPKQTGRKGMGRFGEPTARGTWSPDSSILVYPDPAAHVLRLFDARTGAELGSPIAHDAYLYVQTAFSDDSQRLLTTEARLRPGFGKGEGDPSPDTATGRIRLWDARTGKAIGPPLTGARLGGVVVWANLNPAGDRVAVIVAAPSSFQGLRSARDVSNGLAVHLWDPAAGRPVTPPLVHEQPATRLVFSPDGQWLLTATARHVCLWSTSTGEQLRATPPLSDFISEVAFNQDGRRIVVTMGRPTGPPPTRRSFVQVWDSRTGQPMTPPLRNTPPNGPGGFGGPFAESPRGGRSRNGNRLLVYRDDGTPEVYSLAGDDRPVGELLGLTEVLSARQVNTAGVIQGLGAAGFRESWETTRPKFASEWSNPAVEGSEWDRLCLPPVLGGLGASGLAPFAGRGTSERWSQYLWHLDRLVVAEPDSAALHATRARLLNTRGDHAAAEAAFTRAIDLKSDERKSLLVGRANARAELGKWENAEADLVESLKTPVPEKADFGFTPFRQAEPARLALALLRLRRGDLDAYKADCVQLTAEGPWKGGFNPVATRLSSMWPGLLADGAVPNLKDLLRGVDSDLDSAFEPVGVPMSLRLAAYYRLGRDADVEKLFPILPSPTRADHYFLAMAQHRQREPEARATLEKANATKSEAPPWVGPSGLIGIRQAATGWQGPVVEEVLRKEAERLILGKK
ncbi:MAG TPA: WD40 repeat domain-containing protein, partial [Gemmataceae bacterium]|nr:WD40 repeat domain-containing protein [Gemmataceae bacterium]